jgi:AcrR family transcriptional regulator
MELNVKPRRYDASRRREQARQTRDAILAAARARFLADGYAATTVARIADDAGVSVETIYKSFGGKPGLVRAIWERGLEGAGAIPAERRSDEMRSGATDAATIIERWSTFVTEIAPLAAPILLLARTAAAADAELAELLERAEDARVARMEHNARDLLERGLLRPGIELDEARDILLAYSSAELYDLLVVRRGWPIERYGRFVAAGMKVSLLPDGSSTSGVAGRDTTG